jgi:Histidine kinase-, DNA gyrase B-, and HSP90-like ATPase
MGDYGGGLKREVAEVKFLIHDLRVERFINEVIHFHVTLNVDLEIHGVDTAKAFHEDDVNELRSRAIEVRKSLQSYSNAVKSFSPDQTVLTTGRQYVQDVYEICQLILNPLWGRVDKVLSFLPEESRSVRARNHYRNSIHWICGVYYRIEHFLLEAEDAAVEEEFDVARDVEDFTRNVIHGYVAEKSAARVELQLAELAPGVVRGNRHRFRRMYFNLMMNAVDAMRERKVGVLNVSVVVSGNRVELRVRDTGEGMTPQKIRQLLADRETLDGDLHSLGFVFVRQTVAGFGGELSVESEVGRGTTMTVSLPHLPDASPAPRKKNRCEMFEVKWEDVPAEAAAPGPSVAAPAGKPAERRWGELVYEDYLGSEATFPGSIFAMAVTEDDRVDLFTHRPYDRFMNITHEDLSPMYYLAVVRGRVEEDEEKRPMLILKAPQSVRDYFELRELPESEYGAERFVTMVHDEYIRVARKLLETGLPGDLGVQLTDLGKFFPDAGDLTDEMLFPLEVLARQ